MYIYIYIHMFIVHIYIYIYIYISYAYLIYYWQDRRNTSATPATTDLGRDAVCNNLYHRLHAIMYNITV